VKKLGLPGALLLIGRLVVQVKGRDENVSPKLRQTGLRSFGFAQVPVVG
jgi:hypothetical protein